MKDIFSETNHDNANTFLLILITIVIIGSLIFLTYKNKKKQDNKYNSINSSLQTTGFINF